ncbi:MAG: hypothetical protein QOF37_2451 [Thermoleophilaceae bacterium]|jgi:hypothetical protein|nr:hypothetical protein [Thermoleophilaceae bacterium]
MCPTPTGRIHTRTASILLPALLGLIVSLISGHWDWLVLVGVYYLLGTFLDTAVYSWLLKYQPPWVGFVLALSEFGLLLVLAGILNGKTGGLSHIAVWQAAIFFWACWILAALTKIVILPIASLTYIESAGEFRRTEWSVPAPLESLPILASSAEAKAGPGPVIREASGVHARPLEPLPSPSGVHRVPTG